MPGFRIVYMDDRSGHVTGAHDFSADDDLHAIRQAEDYLTSVTMELWSGSRKIKRWDAAIPTEGGGDPAPELARPITAKPH